MGLIGLLLNKLHRKPIETTKPSHPRELYGNTDSAAPQQRADVYLPRGNGPYPSVILVHGGGAILGHIRSPAVAYLATRLVNVGYAVVSVDYRRVFHGGTMKEGVEDLEQAIDWWFDRIQTYSLDAQRVAMLGIGNGGTLALLATKRHGARLCRVISIYGHYDWCSPRGLLATIMRHFGLGKADPTIFSPLYQLDDVPTPLTLLHGSEDRLAPVVYAKALAIRREQLGLPVDLHTYGGLGHGFLENPSHPQSLSAIEEVLAALHTHRSALDWSGPSPSVSDRQGLQ
jgi:acetyl esterase/lipase